MKRPRTYSPYALEAAQLLGELIRTHRRERGWTQAELAERAGISVPTLAKAEHGDPKVAGGILFELAALLGIRLFDSDEDRLSLELDRARARAALLPKRVPSDEGDDDDDF
jgi:transcriptional regulator with XRE-family HTH domain